MTLLRRHRIVVFLAVLVAALGCIGESGVVNFADDDPAMNAAIAKARETLGEFRGALAAPKPGQTDFNLKVRFDAGTMVEHIWVEEPVVVGHGYRGRLGNEPVHVTSVKLGDSVSFDASRISDWMYVENGVLRGGYTLRVVLEKASPDERARMLESLPFRIE